MKNLRSFRFLKNNDLSHVRWVVIFYGKTATLEKSIVFRNQHKGALSYYVGCSEEILLALVVDKIGGKISILEILFK